MKENEIIYDNLKKQIGKPFTEDKIVDCFPPYWRKEVVMWKTFRDGECNYLAHTYLSHIFRIEVKRGIISNVVMSVKSEVKGGIDTMNKQEIQERILKSETEIAVFQLLRQEVKLGRLINPLRISSESFTRSWIIGRFDRPKFRTIFKLDEKSRGLLLATLVGNAELVDTLPKRIDVVLEIIDDYYDYYKKDLWSMDIILYLYDTESSDFAEVELHRNDIKFDLDEYYGYFDVGDRVNYEEWDTIQKRIENKNFNNKVVKKYEPVTDKPFEMTIGYSRYHKKDK